MTDLQIFLAGLLKIIWNFKFPLFYFIVGLAVIGRREKLEKERAEKAIKRLNTQRMYYQKHSLDRH
jgi:uncharacterized membrane protein YciS (DUF1049 family)